jgi:hypothetical protein
MKYSGIDLHSNNSVVTVELKSKLVYDPGGTAGG